MANILTEQNLSWIIQARTRAMEPSFIAYVFREGLTAHRFVSIGTKLGLERCKQIIKRMNMPPTKYTYRSCYNLAMNPLLSILTK